MTSETATLACVSDTHCRGVGPLPPGDILVHAGDFSITGAYTEVCKFLQWLKSQPHRLKVVIAGNHETTLDAGFYSRQWSCFHSTREDDAKVRALLQDPALLDDGVVYLENSGFTDEVTGLRFWGSPCQPKYGNWAFAIESRAEAAKLWSHIPAGTHVLLTHGPAAGVRDFTMSGKRTGCEELAKAVERVRPVLHVCGHIHEAYGTASLTTGTLSVNASTCDVHYRPTQAPIVVKLSGGCHSQNDPGSRVELRVDCRSGAISSLSTDFGSELSQQQQQQQRQHERQGRSSCGNSDGSDDEGCLARGRSDSTCQKGPGPSRKGIESGGILRKLERQPNVSLQGFKVESVSKEWGH